MFVRLVNVKNIAKYCDCYSRQINKNWISKKTYGQKKTINETLHENYI